MASSGKILIPAGFLAPDTPSILLANGQLIFDVLANTPELGGKFGLGLDGTRERLQKVTLETYEQLWRMGYDPKDVQDSRHNPRDGPPPKRRARPADVPPVGCHRRHLSKKQDNPLGHVLATCPVPDPRHGDIRGCPQCNSVCRRGFDGTHDLDNCRVVEEMPDTQFSEWAVTHLIERRSNRPPLRSERLAWPRLFERWVDRHQYPDTQLVQGLLPWTKEFGRQLASQSAYLVLPGPETRWSNSARVSCPRCSGRTAKIQTSCPMTPSGKARRSQTSGVFWKIESSGISSSTALATLTAIWR